MEDHPGGCGYGPATRNGHGRRTPLHEAAGSGDLDRVLRLITGGADVDAQDEHGWTPLLEAAVRSRRRDVVEALIAGGADPNPAGTMQPHVRVETRCAAGVQGLTPLHWLALAAGEDLVGMAELLIARGAEVGARAANGATPLHQAACCGNRAIAELLIERDAEVDTRDGDWKTPLHQAALKGQAELIRLLTSAGADLGARDLHGWTPLHYATCSCRPEAIAVLLELGADADVVDDLGNAPSDLDALFGPAGPDDRTAAADGSH